ncbi:hypothetical protein ACS127_00765 [Amphibacillus sp. Q70]|uniref:hypothetical protein n=1 Tax=Amphibacillus sp. Q70 TaxID=3453416 RepID=UPI003F848392
MNNSLTLKILDCFSGLYRLLGVDYQTLRLIIGFKLMMDGRRVPTIMSNDRQKPNALLTPFVKSLLLYAFIGLLLIPFLIIGEYFYFQISIVFAMIMFILTTSMISDFSSVLLDVRDKVVLDTKPVDQRTISLAKFTHVVIYMTQLVGALLLIPFVVGSIYHGILFSLLLLLSLILMSIFCIVMTALFYIVILKFFDGEKLRNLINYVQIFLSIALVFVYQFIGRSFELIDMSFSIDWQWWHLLLPPLWFGSLFEMVLLNNNQLGMVVAACFALVVPVLSLWVYFKLMPSFEQNLAKLLNASSAKKAKKHRISQTIAKWICHDQQEFAVFGFAQAMFNRERDFKLKTYPTLGISIALPIFMLVMMAFDGFEINQNINYLYGYFALLNIPTVVYMLKYSAKEKGSFIYQVLPVKEESLFYRATLKAFLVQLLAPVMLFLLIIYLFFMGPMALVHFPVIFLIACALTPISYRIMNNGRYPFLESFAVIESANAGMMMVMMFVIGILAFIHHLVFLFPYVVFLYVLLLCVINWFAWKKAL